MELNMNGLKDFVLALVVITFLAAAGILGINGLMDSDSVGTGASINEENITISGQVLSPAFGAYPYQLTGVSRIANLSGSVLGVELYNVTLTEAGGSAYITLTPSNNASIWNTTYTYKAFDKTMNISQFGKSGILNSTSFFGIIGTLLGVGLLIGVVMLFTRRT